MAEIRNDDEGEEMATKVSKPKMGTTVLGKTKSDADEEVLIAKKQKLEEITDSVDEKPCERAEGEDEEEDDEEYEFNGKEEEEEEEGEESNGKEVVDHKGKGKVVEESESSSGSDSGDAEEDDSDSDLSEDPLDEVDLDNILPSRTRRNVPHRGGIQIGNNVDSDKQE